MDIRDAAGSWQRPLPAADAGGKAYWAAAADGRLIIQHCPACDHRQFYPRELCTRCGAQPQWQDASGRGTVYSFTIVRQSATPPFRDELPYVVAVVELVEGPRMLANVVGCSPDEVHIGMPVLAHAVLVEPGLAIPMWEPAR